MGIGNIIFIICFIAAVVIFALKSRDIYRAIKLGMPEDRSDRKSERLKVMLKVALGQGKMTRRPVAGILHIIVYVGFVIINLEMLEIVIDGITGSHRAFHNIPGYHFLINAFEILALGVLLACVIFLIRRNIMHIRRFRLPEMKGWPKNDANIILIVEVVLMSAFLFMNAADARIPAHADMNLNFAISSHLQGLISPDSAFMVERSCWWIHILGVLAFLNYLPYSKHFHIILAFPNTYFSKLEPKGELDNMESVKKEVEIMFDPSADPYAAPPEPDPNAPMPKFGAKDIQDLTWKNLLDSYTCTECGRCSSVCPANTTGKLLSPRKIMMDTRDRTEEVYKGIKKNGPDWQDGKSLFDYITKEELLACTTCNACVQECPVNIDPVSIIVDLRRFLIMEESSAPQEWNSMFTFIENNGAPWPFAQADRLNWKDEA